MLPLCARLLSILGGSASTASCTAGLLVADWASFLPVQVCIKIEHLNRRTATRMKFTVHEKQMKAQLGVAYDLAKYTEGVDYRRQKTGFGSRVMFRADILDLNTDLSVKNSAKSDLSDDHIALSVVDPSLVEHKQDMAPIIIRPATIDYAVRQAKVIKKYQNQRFVETDTLGKVFVGYKGNQIKLNHFIPVQNGSLFLGDIGQGIGNVLNH